VINKQTLYRHWDAEGNLLYVGVSSRISQRIKEHSKHSKWWLDVASITLEHFETREDVIAAEINAIEKEKPKHNIKHTKKQLKEKKERLVQIETRHDNFTARFVEIPYLLPVSQWATCLGIGRIYIDRAIKQKQLAAIDIGITAGRLRKPRLYCTGWQIIDWLENIGGKPDRVPYAP
jgi:predicted GIY-YIG superfamily endonuclease